MSEEESSFHYGDFLLTKYREIFPLFGNHDDTVKYIARRGIGTVVSINELLLDMGIPASSSLYFSRKVYFFTVDEVSRFGSDGFFYTIWLKKEILITDNYLISSLNNILEPKTLDDFFKMFPDSDTFLQIHTDRQDGEAVIEFLKSYEFSFFDILGIS